MAGTDKEEEVSYLFTVPPIYISDSANVELKAVLLSLTGVRPVAWEPHPR